MCADAARNLAAGAPTADKHARTSVLCRMVGKPSHPPKHRHIHARALRKSLALHGCKTAKKGLAVASDAFLNNGSFFLS